MLLKPNHERELGYQERDYDRLVNRLRSLDYRFEVSVDKGIFLYRLSRYKEVENKKRRKIFSSLLHLDEDFSETKSVINHMYRDSKELLDTDKRIALLNTPLDELNQSEDPFIIFAKNNFEENMEKEKFNKARASQLQKNKSSFIKILRWFYKSQN